MFTNTKALKIPQGDVVKVECNGIVLWKLPVSYKNWVKYAIDTDGSLYNGSGYLDGYRLSSSGVPKAGDSYMTATGFIPAKGGDTIYIGGVRWYSGSGNAQNYLCAYDSNFKYIGSIYGQSGGYYTKKIHSSYVLADTLSTVTLITDASIAYIRVSCRDASTIGQGISGANLIVTVNEEIKD